MVAYRTHLAVLVRHVLAAALLCVSTAGITVDVDSQTITPESLSLYFSPPLEKRVLNQKKVALGKLLFSDVRLSSNGEVSCHSCHDLANGGDDGLTRSTGVTGIPSERNSPSVYYAGEHIAQFWDGRASTLEDQVDGPVQHPNELGNDWPTIIQQLNEDPYYSAEFDTIYQSKPTAANTKDAIAEFERSLAPANSPFDRFLSGDTNALSEEARMGANLFLSRGCVSCHQGPLLGANMYQKLGIYFPYTAPDNSQDFGRFDVTQNADDKNHFKVPSLRNVAETAPYLHDGSIATLEETIDLMAFHQLGRKFSERDTACIAEFLRSLTDAAANPDEKIPVEASQ